jgi:hypothetical protein
MLTDCNGPWNKVRGRRKTGTRSGLLWDVGSPLMLKITDTPKLKADCIGTSQNSCKRTGARKWIFLEPRNPQLRKHPRTLSTYVTSQQTPRTRLQLKNTREQPQVTLYRTRFLWAKINHVKECGIRGLSPSGSTGLDSSSPGGRIMAATSVNKQPGERKKLTSLDVTC